jgi:hypothetical protein
MIGGKGEEKPSYGKSEDEDEESGPALSEMGSIKAAKDVIAALEAGSAKALDKALRAHYEACSE